MSSTALYTFNGNGVDSAWNFPAFTGVPVVEVNGDAHDFTYNTPVGSYRIVLTLAEEIPADPEAEPPVEFVAAETAPTTEDVITVSIVLDADQGV
jgi:hypothetical protein